MTEKLYYLDSHCFSFSARVLECRETEKGCALILDRTAFFPEGGGQRADTGLIGEATVTDVQEKNGEILHYVSVPAIEGSEVSCRINAEQRLRRMQNHSGEHVLSGLIHAKYGYDNVGFHMGDEFMTIDFSGEIEPDAVPELERKANEAVRSNLPVRATFPNPEILKTLSYRSKLDLKENVRIVEIEGIDRCACCAPHVSFTGEIGFIKILSSERHRGGTRMTVVCGMDALDAVNRMQTAAGQISVLLSAKREEISAAVQRLAGERDRLKGELAAAEGSLAISLADHTEETEGNLCLFTELRSESARRELVNRLMPKCRVAAVFSKEEDGWMYIIGSNRLDLRKEGKRINAAICGRGGGRSEMISGRAQAEKNTIEEFFHGGF